MVIKNKFTDHKVLLCFFVHPMDFWQSNDNFPDLSLAIEELLVLSVFYSLSL